MEPARSYRVKRENNIGPPHIMSSEHPGSRTTIEYAKS